MVLITTGASPQKANADCCITVNALQHVVAKPRLNQTVDTTKVIVKISSLATAKRHAQSNHYVLKM
jgi:hypothetical protein